MNKKRLLVAIDGLLFIFSFGIFIQLIPGLPQLAGAVFDDYDNVAGCEGSSGCFETTVDFLSTKFPVQIGITVFLYSLFIFLAVFCLFKFDKIKGLFLKRLAMIKGRIAFVIIIMIVSIIILIFNRNYSLSNLSNIIYLLFIHLFIAPFLVIPVWTSLIYLFSAILGYKLGKMPART